MRVIAQFIPGSVSMGKCVLGEVCILVGMYVCIIIMVVYGFSGGVGGNKSLWHIKGTPTHCVEKSA